MEVIKEIHLNQNSTKVQEQHNITSPIVGGSGSGQTPAPSPTAMSLESLTNVEIDNPIQGQDLEFDATSRKWKNKTPGGGGTSNVNDVKVNGVSVVDSNKEAQVTSYKEVTQSEYNALPDSKLNDDVLYCIKDVDEGDNAYPPLIYSTEEREIGVWIDGKPLYQKSIPINFQTSNTEYDVESNIETFMFVTDATFKIESGSLNGTNYGFYVSANDRVQMYYRPSNHKIVVMSVGSQLLGTGYVTCRYTKITDIPGSGMWTTQGAVAHHYSTNEHIIGTWIDGKPIYEKQFHVTSITANDNWQLIDNTSIDLLIDFECLCITNAGRSGNQTSFRSDKNTPQIQGDNSNGNLYYAIVSGTSISEFYVTARYTKTTD